MKKYTPFLWVTPLLYFVLFGWMDWLPLKKFDESRIAINAMEMYHNHNFLVSYFDGKPEMWNTKPLLLVWVQTFFIHFMGINEVATRMPIAIAALTICAILYYTLIKLTQNKWIAISAIFILITSTGFTNMHGARSGDYDVLLTLFTFINALSFYQYLETEKPKFLFLFFISFILEVYTKSIQGLMFYPAYLIYIIWKDKKKQVLNIRIGVYFIISAVIILAYYFLREQMNPGYIDAVIDNEILGRYAHTLEGHRHPFDLYFYYIIKERFHSWYLLFLVGLFYPYQDKPLSKFIQYLGLLIFSYLLIISFAQTKLIWYDTPLYPLLSIIAAMGFYQILFPIYKSKKKYAAVIFFLVLGFNYIVIFQECYLPRITDWDKDDYKLTYFLKDKQDVIVQYDNINVVWHHYNVQNIFYIYALKEKKKDIQYNGDIKSGQICIFYQESVKQDLESHFQYVKLLEENGVYIYKIT